MPAQPETIIVTGASGGLGGALLDRLLRRYPGANFAATCFRGEAPFEDERLSWRRIDLRDATAIEDWSGTFERVDWLLNCAGFLHGEIGRPEKSVRVFDAEFALENFRLNTLPTLMLARYFGPALKRSPAPLLATISARVGSIDDNRLGGWYSYRMSKAALNMALKTLAIEWRHSHPRGCVAALHPGTNDTALSKPYQANVPPQNLQQPSDTAAMLTDLLAGLDAEHSGNFWAWDGELLPW